jgi:hypothetical protein
VRNNNKRKAEEAKLDKYRETGAAYQKQIEELGKSIEMKKNQLDLRKQQYDSHKKY